MERIKKLLRIIGPGFITGASDDDPSGIATYSQTGAQFGYTQLWTALFSIPFMTIVQEMCGRIGMVTGTGLAGVMRKHYPRPLLVGAVFLLFIANTINIGADLGAMAASAQLLIGIPFIWLLIGSAIVTLLLEVFVSYPTYAKFLKYLTFALFAYVVTVIVVQQNWGEVIRSTFIPQLSFDKDYILNIVAILGTTISPYLFFWQADEEVEEEIEHGKLKSLGRGKPVIHSSDIREMRWDTAAGMLFSNLVMFFIIATTASTLHSHGIKNIETADQAAQALKPIAGSFASLLFTIGVVGTGLLAVPILAGSAAYAVSEMMRWNAGLSKKFSRAHHFYAVIAVSTIIGVFVNFTSIKPFAMLYYTAILNGIAAPPLLAIILLISNNKKIMGTHTNSLFSNALGWTITGIMTIAAITLLVMSIGSK